MVNNFGQKCPRCRGSGKEILGKMVTLCLLCHGNGFYAFPKMWMRVSFLNNKNKMVSFCCTQAHRCKVDNYSFFECDMWLEEEKRFIQYSFPADKFCCVDLEECKVK